MEIMDWSAVYIERSDKETENFIGEEGKSFLQEKISFLKKHKHEFIYIESNHFKNLNIDSVCFELDDVFLTYSVLFGLKAPKKMEGKIRDFLDRQLDGEGNKFALMFDQKDGVWDVNLTFNYVKGFSEELDFAEAFTLIYEFLHQLYVTIK